jgi:hypothetical protein
MRTQSKTPTFRLRALARILRRRLPNVASEGHAESARRAVADALGDFGNAALIAAKEVLRERHAPGEHDFMRRTIARMAESTGPGTRSGDVAEAVWRAATDPSTPMHIPAGADAVQWAAEAR